MAPTWCWTANWRFATLTSAPILHEAEDKPLRIVVGVIARPALRLRPRAARSYSPAVIRRAGKDGILTVLAAQAKLIALPERRLLIDTGDLALDQELAGYWRVDWSLGPRA